MIKPRHYVDYEHKAIIQNENKVYKPSDEADICLSCPLPECINLSRCPRFIEEKKKLKRRKDDIRRT